MVRSPHEKKPKRAFAVSFALRSRSLVHRVLNVEPATAASRFFSHFTRSIPSLNVDKDPDMAKAPKYIYHFGGGKSDGDASLKSLLGGKGANLAEMSRRGFQVPDCFTITTEVC